MEPHIKILRTFNEDEKVIPEVKTKAMEKPAKEVESVPEKKVEPEAKVTFKKSARRK